MRTLIAGTSWLTDPDRLWLGLQWARLGRALNPAIDMVVVDSPTNSGLSWPEFPWLTVIQQPDNIGHLNYGGRDGWGRDTEAALSYAINHGYDYVANFDADLLFMASVQLVFDQMVANEIVAAGTHSGPPYGHWLEGIHFFNVRWLAKRDVMGRYDWEHGTGRFSEERMREAIGPELLELEIPGWRDEGRFTPDTLPKGCVWLTHSTRPVYEELLRRYALDESANP